MIAIALGWMIGALVAWHLGAAASFWVGLFSVLLLVAYAFGQAIYEVRNGGQ